MRREQQSVVQDLCIKFFSDRSKEMGIIID
jgi:hypothetical protein